MNKGLRNEIALLSGLASLGFYLLGHRRSAAAAAGLAVGLKFFPSEATSFAGKSIVIVGGSRGLGFALAKALLREKAHVTLLARDQMELDLAWAKLSQIQRGQLAVSSADIKKKSELKDAFQAAARRFGRIDLVINNAGSISAGSFEAMDENDFEGQMNVHFHGLLNSVESILPIFKSQGFGHIANISSIGGRIPIPHLAPYCASKFAMAGLSQTLSTELWKDGIKVTTVYPGLMRTGSAIQAVFKGETEREFAWFALASSLPGLSLDADVAAERILKGLQEGRTEIRVSWSTKWAFGLQQFFPESLRALLAGVGALLPRGQSSERRTGARSQAWLKNQLWGEPVLKIQKEAQERFNERPREDAAFNLNLEQNPR